MGGLRTPLGLWELLGSGQASVLGQTRAVFCGLKSGRRTPELASRQAGRKQAALKGGAPVAGGDWDLSAPKGGNRPRP